MNMKKTCDFSNPATRWHRHPLITLALAACAGICHGCGISQGQMLYMLGFGERETVEAEFELTKEPILILVDDNTAQVDWPPTIGYLVDKLGQDLIKGGGANRIIPRKTLDNLKRGYPNFAQLSAQRVGQLCGADQVLWLEVDSYFGDEEFYEPTHAAWFAVTVKVLNVHEKERKSRVRLWPVGPKGSYVSVSLDGSEVSRIRTKDSIAKKLAEDLAIDIAKLFMDYVPGDFEK
ncbi:MAG: hypothetical protein ACYTHJ_14600 [Planctomycetota bacterium]|jgi:hypothetical protein